MPDTDTQFPIRETIGFKSHSQSEIIAAQALLADAGYWAATPDDLTGGYYRNTNAIYARPDGVYSPNGSAKTTYPASRLLSEGFQPFHQKHNAYWRGTIHGFRCYINSSGDLMAVTEENTYQFHHEDIDELAAASQKARGEERPTWLELHDVYTDVQSALQENAKSPLTRAASVLEDLKERTPRKR